MTKEIKKKTALGRGLGSLLGDTAPLEEKSSPSPKVTFEADRTPPLKEGFVESSPVTPKEARVWEVSVDKVYPNKEQPRKFFEQSALEELAASIREQGILQPIIVRKKGEDAFEIIAGERRWRAAQKAGLHTVPVIIKDQTDQKALELALIENIQRKDLNPIEEAEAYAALIKDYGLTQQQVAQKVSKERATVANLLRLLHLSPKVRELVASNQISLGQAKVLLAITDPKAQWKWAQKTIKNQWSVRALEKKVQAWKKGKDVMASSAEKQIHDQVSRVSQELEKLYGTRVDIDYKKGVGKITFRFYSEEQFHQMVDRFKNQ